MLHQVEKKKDEEKKSTSTNNFNHVFNTGMPISSNTIAQYLMKKEVSVVKTANHESLSTVNTKLSWKTKIIHDIGPNVEVLRNLGETDEQVYQRHGGIIQGLLLIPVNSRDEMAQRMTAYPHYYLREIITDTDFAQVIDRVLSLKEKSFRIFNLGLFIENFPTCTDRTIELALTDKHFIRLMTDSDDFKWFIKLFPAYVDRIAELILTNDHFSRLIGLNENPIYSIKKFAENFSIHHTERAIELALTDKYFYSMFENKYRLRNFQENFPSYAHRAQELFDRNKNNISSSSSASSTSFSSQSSSSSFTPKLHQPNPEVKIAEQLINYSKTSVSLEAYTALVKKAAEAKVINRKVAGSQKTALYSAIEAGQFERAKVLLVEGHADANIQTADRDTALKLAKRLAVCKAFIPSDNLEEILDLLIRGRHLQISLK